MDECDACKKNGRGGIYRIGSPGQLGCISCMRKLIRKCPTSAHKRGMMAHCERTAPETYYELMEIIKKEKNEQG